MNAHGFLKSPDVRSIVKYSYLDTEDCTIEVDACQLPTLPIRNDLKKDDQSDSVK